MKALISPAALVLLFVWLVPGTASADTVCPEPSSITVVGPLLSIEPTEDPDWGDVHVATIAAAAGDVDFLVLGKADLLTLDTTYEASLYGFETSSTSLGFAMLDSSVGCEISTSIRVMGANGFEEIEIPPGLNERLQDLYPTVFLGFAGFAALIFIFGRSARG